MTTRRTPMILGGLAAAGMALGAAVLFTGSAGATTPPTTPGATAQVVNKTITVNGEGKVTVKPDMATVSLGAQASGLRAAEALDTVNEKTAALVAALKAAGVAEDDIATSGLSVYPNYDRDNKVSGFTASNNVSVTVRDITKTGPVIDAAVAAAGDNITVGGIGFSVADYEAVIGEARAAAMANAKKRAGEYAAAAAVTVGQVVQISEIGVTIPQPLMFERAQAADSVGGAVAPTPVQPGTQELSVTVTVVYMIG